LTENALPSSACLANFEPWPDRSSIANDLPAPRPAGVNECFGFDGTAGAFGRLEDHFTSASSARPARVAGTILISGSRSPCCIRSASAPRRPQGATASTIHGKHSAKLYLARVKPPHAPAVPRRDETVVLDFMNPGAGGRSLSRQAWRDGPGFQAGTVMRHLRKLAGRKRGRFLG
jgi:hypothetical protein